MNRFIKDSLKNIEISGIRQFNQEANKYPDAIKLTIGELDFDTPSEIKNASIQAIDNNYTRYTPNKGILELRQDLSKLHKHYDAEEIIVTVGTTQALSTVLSSIIEAGDEIIIPTPAYVGYKPLIELQNGCVKELDTLRSKNEITEEALEAIYSPKTKAIIVTSPNNPTGHVLTNKEREMIKKFVLEKDILLISDEIYLAISFVDSPSFSEDLDLKNNLVVLQGFSKSHAMTGFRIGYLLSSKELVDQFVKVHQYSVTSASSISQYGALQALKTNNHEMVKELQARRDFIISVLQETKLSYIEPNGAFYVFIDISSTKKDSYTFCKELLDSYKVGLIPGKYFLGNTDHFVRLSYASDMVSLQIAMQAIKEYTK